LTVTSTFDLRLRRICAVPWQMDVGHDCERTGGGGDARNGRRAAVVSPETLEMELPTTVFDGVWLYIKLKRQNLSKVLGRRFGRWPWREGRRGGRWRLRGTPASTEWGRRRYGKRGIKGGDLPHLGVKLRARRTSTEKLRQGRSTTAGFRAGDTCDDRRRGELGEAFTDDELEAAGNGPAAGAPSGGASGRMERCGARAGTARVTLSSGLAFMDRRGRAMAGISGTGEAECPSMANVAGRY
jgi:hypothetical protein